MFSAQHRKHLPTIAIRFQPHKFDATVKAALVPGDFSDQQGICAESLADRLRIEFPILVAKRCTAGNHSKLRQARETIDDALRNSFRQILELILPVVLVNGITARWASESASQ